MKRNNTGFVVLGLIVLCAVLTVGMFIGGQSPKDNAVPQITDNEVKDVTVSDITDTSDGITISEIEQGETAELDSGDTDNIALTTTPEKPKQPEPPETAHKEDRQEKPTDPVLTNPDVKPDSNPKPAETTPPKQATPNSGDKDGKGNMYIPGFGWVKDEGGGGHGEQSQLDPEHADFNKIIGY